MATLKLNLNLGMGGTLKNLESIKRRIHEIENTRGFSKLEEPGSSFEVVGFTVSNKNYRGFFATF